MDFNFSVQVGNDLGEKMANAFHEVFSNGYSKVLIIGSDVPDISSQIIIEVFNLLKNNDVVISPSSDGGYSLLGMNKNYLELFSNVNWSTNTVFISTKEKINSGNLKLKTISILEDIDTIDELRNWMMITNNRKMKQEFLNLAGKENVKL